MYGSDVQPAGQYSYQWQAVGFELQGSTSGKNLIIAPGALNPGSTYSVTLSVKSISGSGGIGWAEATFVVNLPPTGGLFKVSPSSGVFLSTLFSLTFLNWQDPDSVSPLSYSVCYPLHKNKFSFLTSVFLICGYKGVGASW